MPTNPDHKRVIRIAGVLVALGGSGSMLLALMNFLHAVRDNAIEGSPVLLGFPEYYRRVGTYYSRGFTTGFFLCYFLMLFAVIVGTWVDQILKARRAAALSAHRPGDGLAPATPPLET